MADVRILGVVLLVVLAGCGGDFVGERGVTDTGSATSTATPVASPPEISTPGDAPIQTEAPTATPTATGDRTVDRAGDSRAAFHRFVRAVDERAAVGVEGEYVNDSVVRLTTTNDLGDRDFDADAGKFPVPQATAYVVHDSATGVYRQDHLSPERVEFVVRYNGEVAQTFALDRQTAIGFAELSITNGQFRERIRGSLSNTSAHPGAQLLRYVSGERRRDTRMATARALKTRIEERLSARIGPENVGDNITDIGIYQDSVTFDVSDGNVTYPAGSTIYVEFQIPRDGGQEFLSNSKRRGISINQSLLAWAEVVSAKPYGDVPANLRIRLIDFNGTLYWTIDNPEAWVDRYNRGTLDYGGYFLNSLRYFLKAHNGGAV